MMKIGVFTGISGMGPAAKKKIERFPAVTGP